MKMVAFRLYPNTKQRQFLEHVLAKSRLIYNEMFEHTNQDHKPLRAKILPDKRLSM